MANETRPSSSNWSVEFKREASHWGNSFTEHWRYKHEDGSVAYKRRVVGPNGEVCRDDGLEPETVPSEVRAAFEDAFRDAANEA